MLYTAHTSQPDSLNDRAEQKQKFSRFTIYSCFEMQSQKCVHSRIAFERTHLQFFRNNKSGNLPVKTRQPPHLTTCVIIVWYYKSMPSYMFVCLKASSHFSDAIICIYYTRTRHAIIAQNLYKVGCQNTTPLHTPDKLTHTNTGIK